MHYKVSGILIQLLAFPFSAAVSLLQASFPRRITIYSGFVLFYFSLIFMIIWLTKPLLMVKIDLYFKVGNILVESFFRIYGCPGKIDVPQKHKNIRFLPAAGERNVK